MPFASRGTFACPKCESKDCEQAVLRLADGVATTVDDVFALSFTTLTCTRCGYTEMYRQRRVEAPVVTLPDRTPLDAESERESEPETGEEHFIEIELLDEEGKPKVGERYFIELPDGSTKTGRLNTEGKARVEGVEPGTAKVSFPDFDKESYEPK